ncbi:hypothetical protein Ppro_2374 [Pelobacter propionicus DSM 2379]|uniref:Uncharacterized protein n=1 Tax=Pelobacter propionicus (strain DSM 2379 / NBRC 103807 / OttBd1) TaxID=338966 RepID=A1ARL0_PELPD|nr:hypothetical protein Ppro_2374 [Pelobacter propionicus DSM 2379]
MVIQIAFHPFTVDLLQMTAGDDSGGQGHGGAVLPFCFQYASSCVNLPLLLESDTETPHRIQSDVRLLPTFSKNIFRPESLPT